MGSKRGRKNDRWKSPVQLTMKVCLGRWKEEGKNVLTEYCNHFPNAQEFFNYPLTKEKIESRAGWDVPTKNGENPDTNKFMKPYVPAANEIIRRYKKTGIAMTNEELTRFCEQYKPVVIEVRSRRREIKPATRSAHVAMVHLLGGRCPCCSRSQLTDEFEQKIAGAFDHFYTNQAPNFEHSWLICQGCHDEFTYNRTSREDHIEAFRLYQKRAVAYRKQKAAE